MPRATETKDIDGLTFGVTQMDAWTGLETLNRIGKAFGPGLAQLAGSLKAGGLAEMDVDGEALSRAVMSLFQNLTAAELRDIAKTLLVGATLGGTPLDKQFNDALAGKMGTLLKLLAFAFEVNYRDFTGGLRARVAQALAGAKSASPSTVSTT